MRNILYVIAPCLVLPGILFAALVYPVLNEEVDKRLPLLSVYYISRQLSRQIAQVDSCVEGIAPNHRSTIAEYGSLSTDDRIQQLASLSASTRKHSTADNLVAAFILWKKRLPHDFLQADPVGDIRADLGTIRVKQSCADAKEADVMAKLRLEYLKHRLPGPDRLARVRNELPPLVFEKGLDFCGEAIPLERPDLRRRIEYQIEYLLTDLRESTGIWLKRRDRYGELIRGIVEGEGLPGEFSLLPALESGYSATAMSGSQARGWWQFVKGTALNSQAGDPELDWTLRVDKVRDERCDLALSTRSAARYLKWMRSKLSNSSEKASWLTVAAAYNAGLNEIRYRMGAYRASSFWDMKLPLETEYYVPRWIAFAIIDAHRSFYGLDVPVSAPIQFETIREIRLARDLPLGLLAILTESSVRSLKELNGSVQKGETAFRAQIGPAERGADAVQTIHVPSGSKDSVLKALKARGYLKDDPAAAQ